MDNQLIPKVRSRRALTGIRSIIAKRMRLSLDQAAQAVHVAEVDMSSIMDTRSRLKAAGSGATVTDLLIKAVALALAETPELNSELIDNQVTEYEDVNISLAIAVKGGLLTPVIRNADKLSLDEIGALVKELTFRAKNNKLTMDDMTGGTFTISNLGMYGLDQFTAIINPPQAGILAIGAAKKRAVVNEKDEIEIRPVMKASLTYDHRILDGAPAAEFLMRFRKICEGIIQ